MAHHRGDTRELLVARNGGRLNKEFVSALGVVGDILLHSLEEDWKTSVSVKAT